MLAQDRRDVALEVGRGRGLGGRRREPQGQSRQQRERGPAGGHGVKSTPRRAAAARVVARVWPVLTCLAAPARRPRHCLDAPRPAACRRRGRAFRAAAAAGRGRVLRPDPVRAAEGERHRLRHEPEPLGAPPPAGDDGGRHRALRLRQRRQARRLPDQRREDDRARQDRARLLESPVPQPRRLEVRGLDREGRTEGSRLRQRRRHGRLRQRRLQRPVRRRPEGERALPQQGRRHFRGRDGEGRPREARPRLRDALGRGGSVLRLRQGRRPRPLRLQLRDLGSEDGAALRTDRDPRLLPSQQLQGAAQLALPQRGQRHVHGRLEGLGDPRGDRQGHGAGNCRLRPGRLPRHIRGERHRAQLSVPQPRQRYFRGDGLRGGRRLPGVGPAALGHGQPTRATSTTTASPTSSTRRCRTRRCRCSRTRARTASSS